MSGATTQSGEYAETALLPLGRGADREYYRRGFSHPRSRTLPDMGNACVVCCSGCGDAVQRRPRMQPLRDRGGCRSVELDGLTGVYALRGLTLN